MSRDAADARSKPIPSLLMAVVVSLLILLAIASLGSYRDLAAARDRQRSLQRRIEETRVRNGELADRIWRLQTDPAALERVAREQYRMIKPGDVVIVYPEEPETISPAGADPEPTGDG